jgi:hypothetical protein
MARKRFIRVGTSDPVEYTKIEIKKVTCDYYLQVFNEERKLDPKLEETLIMHLLRTRSPLLIRKNIREEITVIYHKKYNHD